MMRLSRTTIAKTLLSAPGWARVGLTAPVERLRDEAAEELARAILEGVGLPDDDGTDPDQLGLAL